MMSRVIGGYERLLPPDHPDILIAKQDLACYLGRDGNSAEAEALFREALAGYDRKLGLDHPDTLRTVNNFAQLLDKAGKTEEARPLHLRYVEAQSSNEDAAPLLLRQLAGTYYRLGQYAEAVPLLKRVLQSDFEVPSTHCHLARIALLTDDLPAAREHAAQAWAHRADAQPYVLPRILWLDLAVALLGGDAASVGPLLGRLKAALRTEGAVSEWAMEPVLAHLQPKLGADDHAILTALMAAVSLPDRVADLDQFAAWREAVADGLD